MCDHCEEYKRQSFAKCPKCDKYITLTKKEKLEKIHELIRVYDQKYEEKYYSKISQPSCYPPAYAREFRLLFIFYAKTEKGRFRLASDKTLNDKFIRFLDKFLDKLVKLIGDDLVFIRFMKEVYLVRYSGDLLGKIVDMYPNLKCYARVNSNTSGEYHNKLINKIFDPSYFQDIIWFQDDLEEKYPLLKHYQWTTNLNPTNMKGNLYLMYHPSGIPEELLELDKLYQIKGILGSPKESDIFMNTFNFETKVDPSESSVNEPNRPMTDPTEDVEYTLLSQLLDEKVCGLDEILHFLIKKKKYNMIEKITKKFPIVSNA